MYSNLLSPYDQRIDVKNCSAEQKEPGVFEKHRANMKEECKRAPDREVRYVAFKSYHAKPPAPSVAAQTTKKAKSVKSSTIDQRVKLSAKKPPRKKLSTSDRSTVSKYKGDSAEQVDLQDEPGHVRQNVADLQETLEKVQAENESMKQSLAATVPLATHQQVQEELRDAQQKYSDVRVELETLLEQKRTLQQSVDEMTTKLERVDRENGELNDRVELTIDKMNYLEKKANQLVDVEAKYTAVQSELQELQNQHNELQSQHQELHNQHHELHIRLQEMSACNEELVATNEQTAQTLQNLQSVVNEQKLKMEDYANVKRKLKQTELEVQKVVNEKEVSSKFVELMESENMSMKQKNGTLVEQNAKLSKDLVDMKKKMEHLRQKFDDVNKENKLLREKEARYLIHERINVGKYSKYPLTIADDARSSYGRTASSSSVFRLPSYPLTNPPRRAKSKNEFDIRLHQLLHRRNSTERILKAKFRKH